MIDVTDLLGVPWKHEEADCYTLACKFYKQFYDIELTNYARPPLWFITNPELDLIRSNFRNEGFVPFLGSRREMLPGDAILIAYCHHIINHCAIYLGSGWMLHAPFRGKSEKVLYAGNWLDRTMVVGRHPAVVAQPEPESVNFLSLITSKKQKEIESIYETSGRASGLHNQ